MNFFQFSSQEISAWILVLISFDRLMSVSIMTWKTIHFKPKRALSQVSFLKKKSEKHVEGEKGNGWLEGDNKRRGWIGSRR